MSNYISYYDLLKSRDQFRKSGGRNSGASEFNYYDTPGHKYFKIFFYFDNEDSDLDGVDNGLLAPTWMRGSVVKEDTYYLFNSAWSYLKMNADDNRAALVEKFVNLLSNISSESPWYFSEISGLDAALERKQPMSNAFSIEEARPKISIKCLPDSFDDRIGTLLDLYRAIVWDWSTKREMLPANLRKFDMGIFIFETAAAGFHVRKEAYEGRTMDSLSSEDTAVIGNGNSDIKTSYKYIELHNCEIDYNSSKNLYSNLNNKEGFSPEYAIDIHFDDCYESRHNEFISGEFGDIIVSDFFETYQKSQNVDYAQEWIHPDGTESWVDDGRSDVRKSIKDKNNTFSLQSNYGVDGESEWGFSTGNKNEGSAIKSRLPEYPRVRPEANGFLANMADQLIDTGLDKVNSLLKKKVLGNLYTFSLTRIGNQIKSLAQGNVIGAVRDVQGYINNANVKEKQHFNQARLSPEPTAKTLPTISENHNLFTNSEYYLGTTGGKMFDEANVQKTDLSPSFFPEAAAPTEHKVAPLYEKANVQKTDLSPSFMEPTGYEMGQPSGSLPGEVKPKEQHKQSDMFPRNTPAWTKSNGGLMFEKKKIKPSVKYISNMFEGSSIANNL